MTKDIMTYLLTELRKNKSLKQVEPYEGQFEDISDFLIVPPAAFVALSRGSNNAQQTMEMDYFASIYLVTNHIHCSGHDDMLDLIDTVIATLHFSAVRVSSYSGRCLLSDFEWLGIYPGFSAYKLNFSIRT